MAAKFVQLQPWHDQLLGLTDEGEVYRITLYQDGPGGWHMRVDAVPLFSGFPPNWRRP